jgi:WD40 repeat protein
MLLQHRQYREERGRSEAQAADAAFQKSGWASAQHALRLRDALSLWAQRDFPEMGRVLDAVDASFQRTWEQRHLRALHDDEATRQEKLSLRGLTGPVTCVAVSAGGRRLVTGSEGGAVQVWDAWTGRHQFDLEGHRGPVTCVAVSDDGTRVVSGGADRTVRVWDVARRREVFCLTGHTGEVTGVAVSADHHRIVSGSGGLYHQSGEVKVWWGPQSADHFTLDGPRDAAPKAVGGVALSADGKRVAAGSASGAVRVWDARTGRHQFDLEGHTRRVNGVAFSADGKLLASGSEGGAVRLWDARTGEEKFTLRGHRGAVTGVALSPDGLRVVSGGADKTVRVWDTATGQEKLALLGHTLPVTGVAWGADGRHIVSAGGDRSRPKKAGEVKVWDAPP